VNDIDIKKLLAYPIRRREGFYPSLSLGLYFTTTFMFLSPIFMMAMLPGLMFVLRLA
jgi:hypothetical protein